MATSGMETPTHHRVSFRGWRVSAVRLRSTSGHPACFSEFLCSAVEFNWQDVRFSGRRHCRHHPGASHQFSPDRVASYERSGLIQRRPGNRMKSVSAETISTPCSIARAASCASGTRFPEISTWSHSLAYTRAVSSVAGGIQATGIASQSSTYRQASEADNGLSVNRGCVAILRKAPMVCQGSPTRLSPSSTSCSQDPATAL